MTNKPREWLADGNEPTSGWFAYLRILARETMEHRGLAKRTEGIL